MLLNQVFKILTGYISGAGYRNPDCFDMILKDFVYADDADSIKKIFAGTRALTQETMRSLCNAKGFETLCKNISENYLPIAGNHYGIFNDLSSLLHACAYMRQEDKAKIIAACDYKQAVELSRFISACIICGNYNTVQNKSSNPLIKENYSLNIDFMNFGISMESVMLKNELWTASQRSYIESHRKGNRFYSLNIIERLLPYGYVDNNYFLSQGKTEDGTVDSLIDLCKSTDENIAIVGDGGIGKTTFLQHMMQETYLSADGKPSEYMTHLPVLFFIELNRCPEHINDWYNDALKKSNYITRYICQIKENHSSLDSVSQENLELIEKEFQKIPKDGEKPQYLLLLDGFNEVRSDNSVRTFLSNEISVLSNYPNLRIITTSRETQSAYYASEFKTLRVVGLTDDNIISYLYNCKIPEHIIGNAMACESLVRCLKIPLYLCMFSANKTDDDYLPQTAGEILYSFFHRKSAFYNARTRIQEIRSSKLNNKQIALVLDFIIPYIGWIFEINDCFSVNQQGFYKIIKESLENIKYLLCIGSSNPFKDFDYSCNLLKKTVESFYTDEETSIELIVSCIYDHLGIMYEYKINEGDFSDRIRFSFCHHHFRDYFSAMWDIQLLSMLQCIEASDYNNLTVGHENRISFEYYLDKKHWQAQKVEFISEVLMEHRNRPVLDSYSLNWFLPKPVYDEQRVLTHAIDFCRLLCKNHIEIKHILQNVLSAILFGRKEYSGLNLSGLNLKNCRFFNITCSRKGKSKTLSADFSSSILTQNNFIPENHQNQVIEYLYSENQCFTIDDEGIIKCWDILSGKMEYELYSGDPLGISDFSTKGYIKISRDRHWLAAKVQETHDDGDVAYVKLFDLSNPESEPKTIIAPERHKLLSYFSFTYDSKSLLILCDRETVYCVDLTTQNIIYKCRFNLNKQSELYAESSESCIFAYTAEYNTYETDPAILSSWINDDSYDGENDDWDYDDDEDDEIGLINIPCEIFALMPDKNEMHSLYYYTGVPGTEPTVAFIADKNCFIFFNYDTNSIEQYNCNTNQCSVIFENLADSKETPPSSIHVHPLNPNELYIIYPDICFNVEISDTGIGSILMTYKISGVEKLRQDSDDGSNLEFKPNVCPTMNRFILADDINTYEWDSANDQLYLKYNCAYYNCSALFADSKRGFYILVHECNGLSVFGGNPIRLAKQYCFQEPGYWIDGALFDSLYNIIVLPFKKPEHEKIILLDLTTGMQKDIYSTVNKGETIENICFSDDSKNLLITTQYKCTEYDLEQDKLFNVSCSENNERFVSGNYVNNEIEIAVVENSCAAKPRIKPFCVYYQKITESNNRQYNRAWAYEMPMLRKTDSKFFLHAQNDLGALGSIDENGFQKYWVTKGFFLKDNETAKNYTTPKCYKWIGKRKTTINKQFKPLDMIFLCHSFALENQYGCGKTGYSYLYLSDDMNEAVFSMDRTCLFYCHDLKNLTYNALEESFEKYNKKANPNAYWDFVVPQNANTLLGCYENYNLISIDANDNRLLDTIEYHPGISIIDCNFSDAVLDEGAKSIVFTNQDE